MLRQKFGMTDLQDFMPHLSLLYSDMDMLSRCVSPGTRACMHEHQKAIRQVGAAQGESRC